jgi:hypothetical protein
LRKDSAAKEGIGLLMRSSYEKVTNKTEEHQSKGLKRDDKTSGITYHLSKLLGQLVETVKGLRWCSSPLSERNIARRFSWPCCKTHDEMEEGVGDCE